LFLLLLSVINPDALLAFVTVFAASSNVMVSVNGDV